MGAREKQVFSRSIKLDSFGVERGLSLLLFEDTTSRNRKRWSERLGGRLRERQGMTMVQKQT